MTCEWPICQATATHTVTVDYPDGAHKVWHVCSEHDKDLKKQVQRSIPLPEPAPASPPTTIQVTCSDCGQLIAEQADLPAEQRVPCGSCGSKKRMHRVELKSELGLHSSLGVRHARPGRKGWVRRLLTGDFFSTFHGAWTRRELDIDEDNNSYREQLVHYDGTVVESQAKLSDHRGH
jgi:ribosomal protein S27AE